MLEQPEPKGLERYIGGTVFSSDGEKIGSIDEFHYHRLSGVAEWIAVTTGFLVGRQFIVPVAGSSFESDGVHIPYTKDIVAEAPEVEIDDGLTSEAESMLSSYFGLGAQDAGTEGPRVSP